MINMDGGWVFVIAVVITGLVVVFLALVILILFVDLLGRLFVSLQNNSNNKSKKPDEPKLPEKEALPVVQTESAAMNDGDDDEVIAVISAAVAMMSLQDGKNYKIKSVRKSKSANKSGERPVWAMAGIQQNTMPF